MTYHVQTSQDTRALVAPSLSDLPDMSRRSVEGNRVGRGPTHVRTSNFCSTFSKAVLDILSLAPFVISQASNQVIQGFLKPEILSQALLRIENRDSILTYCRELASMSHVLFHFWIDMMKPEHAPQSFKASEQPSSSLHGYLMPASK